MATPTKPVTTIRPPLPSAVIVNPATIEDMPALRQLINSTLRADGWPEPKWFETSPHNHGKVWLQNKVAEGTQVVFACGGDGTVMAALSVLAKTEVALAVLSTGTANILAYNLGLPSSLVECIRLATSGQRRQLDLGEANSHPFAAMAGMGIDAKIMINTQNWAKRRLGWLAYALTALRHLGEKPFLVGVKLDGGACLQRRVHSVMVGNVGQIAGGINLLPAASLDDGYLDVILIAPRRFYRWPQLLLRTHFGLLRGNELETFQAAHIEITTDAPQLIEVDGNALSSGSTLTVQVLPKALVVCVSASNLTMV